ncbi:MAG: hypothetical protein WAO83_15900 [Fuerstiella sp.]
MTNLKFVGDLPLWIGLLSALLVAGMSWRFYRRESLDLSRNLRWQLPFLRSLAFALGVLVLTQPVLHHRKTIGEPGRVNIYLDASQSMAMLDRHMSIGRKLMIAEQQDWLQPGTLNTASLQSADRIAEFRTAALAILGRESLTDTDLRQLQEQLQSELSQLTADVPLQNMADSAQSEASLTDLITTLSGLTASAAGQPIDVTAERLTDACTQLLPIEQRLRSLFEDQVQTLAESGDEAVAAALTMFNDTPRWRRAERSLLETSHALLAELKAQHNIEVLALQDIHATELWNGLSNSQIPAQLSASPDTATTNLSSGLAESQDVQVNYQASEATDDDSSADSEPKGSTASTNTAVVLFTDGQHNSGPSVLQTARILGSQGVAVFPIAMGATTRAPDVAVSGLEYPEMVFRKDRVRGTIIIDDAMPAGQPMFAEVTHQQTVLWREQLLTQNTGERRIEFEFDIDQLVDEIGAQFDSTIKKNAVPISLTASIVPLEGEAELQNNSRALRFSAITQNHRLLLLDGRSRWETRYLKNVFERDPQWDIDVIIAGPGNDEESLPHGTGNDTFPETRDALFDYDLIIFGEIDAELFADHEFTWLREFVEVRGGGIVFIDGSRRKLSQLTEQNLKALLPVEWKPVGIASKPGMLQLTDKGAQEPALTLDADINGNKRFWNELPSPHSLNHVDVLPGAEILVEAVVDAAPVPFIVTRSYGAGRVLYLASDETWRWRYKAADTYHQRIWNQLARFVMPRPFAVKDEFLSIDTGPVSYKHGDSANIRIRLLGLDGKPTTDSIVDALIWKDGQIVATTSLTADVDVPGIYRGNSGELVEGEYEVSIQASGFNQNVLKARGQFVVLPPESSELQSTACNEQMLKQMAAESGGQYLREEQVGQLAALLSPLSNGRIVESDTQIWQSYWWFAAIIALLTLEWALRKRAGML